VKHTRKPRWFKPEVAILGVVLLAALLGWQIERRYRPLHRLYDQVRYEAYNHYLPCEALPTAKEAEAILADHAEAAERIRQTDPGYTDIVLDTERCPGRADAVITYFDRDDRRVIEAILSYRVDFFGIPARWRRS